MGHNIIRKVEFTKIMTKTIKNQIKISKHLKTNKKLRNNNKIKTINIKSEYWEDGQIYYILKYYV